MSLETKITSINPIDISSDTGEVNLSYLYNLENGLYYIPNDGVHQTWCTVNGKKILIKGLIEVSDEFNKDIKLLSLGLVLSMTGTPASSSRNTLSYDGLYPRKQYVKGTDGVIYVKMTDECLTDYDMSMNEGKITVNRNGLIQIFVLDEEKNFSIEENVTVMCLPAIEYTDENGNFSSMPEMNPVMSVYGTFSNDYVTLTQGTYFLHEANNRYPMLLEYGDTITTPENLTVEIHTLFDFTLNHYLK